MARTHRHKVRHRKSQKKSGGPSPFFEWSVCAAAAVILAAVCIGQFQQRIYPAFESVASTEIRQSVTQIVEQTIHDNILQDLNYEDLIHLERDGEGRVAAMSTNMVQVNRMKNEAVTTVSKALGEMGSSDFSVPLGSLTNIPAWSSRGLKIPVTVQCSGTIKAELVHDFTDAGINQSRHQITLKLEIPLTAVFSGRVWEDTVSSEILVGETVIVGAVPSTYLQMSS